jgi:hypothetical protein
VYHLFFRVLPKKQPTITGDPLYFDAHGLQTQEFKFLDHLYLANKVFYGKKCRYWIFKSNMILYRSQWPRGVRHGSAASRLLRSWVRIAPGAWMSVCCDCRVLSGRGLCDELITLPEESYRLWWVVCDHTSWMRRPWPHWGLSRQKQTNNIIVRWRLLDGYIRLGVVQCYRNVGNCLPVERRKLSWSLEFSPTLLWGPSYRITRVQRRFLFTMQDATSECSYRLDNISVTAVHGNGPVCFEVFCEQQENYVM